MPEPLALAAFLNVYVFCSGVAQATRFFTSFFHTTPDGSRRTATKVSGIGLASTAQVLACHGCSQLGYRLVQDYPDVRYAHVRDLRDLFVRKSLT